MRMMILCGILLAACSPYTSNEFTSCEEYPTEVFTHPGTSISVALPTGWDTELDVFSDDTLSVTSVDSAALRSDGIVRTVGFMAFPSKFRYRDNWSLVQKALADDESFLRVERGLIRLEGKALEYLIGNEELYSVIVIPYQAGQQMVTIVARIERRDHPVLNDFCYLGPVLKRLVRDLSGTRT